MQHIGRTFGEGGSDGQERGPEQEHEFRYEILADPEARAELKDRVDHLIEQIIDKNIDTVVFLDKSARPISWLFREMWRRKLPERPHPDIRFFAIGRTDPHRPYPPFARLWELTHEFVVCEPTGRQLLDARKLPPGMIRREPEARNELMKYITKERGYTAQSLQKDVEAVRNIYGRYWEGPGQEQAELTNAVVVDEYSERGTTQQLAALMLEQAFPKTHVYSTNLFSSEEMEHIPWLQHQGMTGVVELADDKLLASPASVENLDKLRDELLAAFTGEKARMQSEVEDVIARFESGEIEAGLAAVRRQSFAQQKRSVIEQYEQNASRLRDLCRTFLEQLDRPIPQLLSDAEDLEQAVRQTENDFFELKKNTLDSLWYYKPYAALMSTYIPTRTFIRAGESLQKLDDIPSLLAAAKQLRKEMKHLATE
jgi:hypothetical protein